MNLNDVINEVKRNSLYDLSEAPLLTILAKKPKLDKDNASKNSNSSIMNGGTILDFSAKLYPQPVEQKYTPSVEQELYSDEVGVVYCYLNNEMS